MGFSTLQGEKGEGRTWQCSKGHHTLVHKTSMSIIVANPVYNRNKPSFMSKTHSCNRKAKKWWLRLFYFLLDMATTNAYIIHKESTTIKLTQKEFIMAVAERLMSSYSSRKRPPIKSLPSGVRFQGHHFPDKQQTSHNCCMCEDRLWTVFCCRVCPTILCYFKIHKSGLPSTRG